MFFGGILGEEKAQGKEIWIILAAGIFFHVK